jgi:hypothetical protein
VFILMDNLGYGEVGWHSLWKAPWGAPFLERQSCPTPGWCRRFLVSR